MEVSRKTDYALRILSILVKNPDKVISVRDAAQASDVRLHALFNMILSVHILSRLCGVRKAA